MHFSTVEDAETPYNLLTLRGCSIVRGGHDIVTSLFADKGCWWVDCRFAAFNCLHSIPDTRSKIVHVLLTLS